MGVLPAGLGARNTLRLEAGNLLCGSDMDRTTTPLEAGLGFAVSFEKAGGFFEIHSRHIRIRMRLGGVILDASKSGVLVKIYGDPVSFGPAPGRNGTLQEGFKFLRLSGNRGDRLERMGYKDTVDWQSWTRQWYEMKDDFYSDRLEKTMSR